MTQGISDWLDKNGDLVNYYFLEEHINAEIENIKKTISVLPNGDNYLQGKLDCLLDIKAVLSQSFTTKQTETSSLEEQDRQQEKFLEKIDQDDLQTQRNWSELGNKVFGAEE